MKDGLPFNLRALSIEANDILSNGALRSRNTPRAIDLLTNADCRTLRREWRASSVPVPEMKPNWYGECEILHDPWRYIRIIFSSILRKQLDRFISRKDLGEVGLGDLGIRIPKERSQGRGIVPHWSEAA